MKHPRNVALAIAAHPQEQARRPECAPAGPHGAEPDGPEAT